MKLVEYVRAAVQGWWIILLCVLLGLGASFLVTSQITPVHQSSVTFYVVAPVTENLSPLQADELVRGRIIAYPGLMTSDQFVERITGSSGMDLDEEQVANSISAFGDPETLTLTVDVSDVDSARSLEIATQIADNFGKMVNDVERVAGSASEGTVLTAISGPSLAPAPVSPRPILNLAIGGLLGLAAGALIIIARARTDRTVRSIHQLDLDPSMRPLATVPDDHAATKLSPKAATYLHTRLAEGVRGLRTNIQFHPHQGPLQLLAVTSAAASEGRTTTALTLALVMAEAKQRVLLVEADLRRPSLAARLDLPDVPGLVDVLHGEIEATEAVQRVGTLDVLVAGSASSHPSELLASGQMRDTFSDLRTRYDVIVLDTPALHPYTDAALVCAASDGTVVVVGHGKTTRDELSAALVSLDAVRSNVLGTVLNMAPGAHSPSLPAPAASTGRRSTRVRDTDNQDPDGGPAVSEVTAARLPQGN
ncbi:polysaccharide biosynthesis tyrosine autokinase [Arthrobacter sp. CAN_A1]|uniref:polysaccharide biosynthesis tyrosine autokinase n=1 Tax=Arthrobacter sp. CAN_A1 TaxID=2787717 RepID=UPI0018CA8FF3